MTAPRLPQLLEALRALPAETLDAVLSMRIEPSWPSATVEAELAAGLGTTQHLDVTREGVMTVRPPGPRRVEDEPEVRARDWSTPDPIIITIDGGDLWAQCMAVVESRILGTTDAAEHVTRPLDGGKERTWYFVVGRGAARSGERADWIRRHVSAR